MIRCTRCREIIPKKYHKKKKTKLPYPRFQTKVVCSRCYFILKEDRKNEEHKKEI